MPIYSLLFDAIVTGSVFFSSLKTAKKSKQKSRENLFTVSFVHPVQTDDEFCCCCWLLWSVIFEFWASIHKCLCVYVLFSLWQTRNWCQLKYFSCLCVCPLNNNWVYDLIRNEKKILCPKVKSFIIIIAIIIWTFGYIYITSASIVECEWFEF